MITLKHRSGLVGLVAIAVLAAACSSSSKTSSPTTSSSTSSSSSTGASSSSTTPTTTPAPKLSTAVWPTAASGIRYQSPTDATRAFATTYLHFAAPIVGQFRQGDARSGEVDVRATAAGPVTTVIVRQLDRDSSWWVLGAGTPNIKISEPAALATISSPVALRGTSTAFEATVQVSIREDGSTKALAETFVMGGANGRMGPFDAKVKFASPSSRYGAVVLYTVSSADGHVTEASVIRVGFPPA